MPVLLCQYLKFGGFGESGFQPSVSASGLVFLEEGICATGFELHIQITPKVQNGNAKMSFLLLFLPQFVQDLSPTGFP